MISPGKYSRWQHGKLAKSFTAVSAEEGITEASALTGSVPSHCCDVMRESCFCLMQVAS